MITKQQAAILDHTLHRAAQECYCGDSPTMQELVAAGLMRSLGRVAWCPDEYFTITAAGREALREWRAAQPVRPKAKKRRTSRPFEVWRIHWELGYNGGFAAFWRDVWPTAKYRP